jgi:hypothetical protein
MIRSTANSHPPRHRKRNSLALSVGFTVHENTNPPAKKVDTLSTLDVVYQFL